MKTIRIIFLFPLALIRLIFVFLISLYTVVVGWIWLKFFGFSRKMQQKLMSDWGKGILFFLGYKIDRNEIPENKNFILMPNHRSYLDIMIVAALVPSSMVSKEELKNWPLGSLGIKITNSILVNRKDIGSMIKTMHQIKTTVNQGIPVTLFPEGTTFKGPLTKPFKNGSFKIAAETNIPVIPMAIHYCDADDAWVGNDTFIPHFFRQMSKPVSRVFVRFGPVVTGSDYKIIQQNTREEIDLMLTKVSSIPCRKNHVN